MTGMGVQNAEQVVRILDGATQGSIDEDKRQHFVRLFARYDASLINETVRRICASDSYFPSEARIRHVMSEVIAARQAMPALPSGDVASLPVHPDVVRANIVVLREIQSAAFQADLRRHLDADHPLGWTEDQRGELTRAVVFDKVVALCGREPFPDPSSSKSPKVIGYACSVCRDQLWVERVDRESGELSVTGCEACAPVLERRRREGHFRRDHRCPECTDIQKMGRDGLKETKV